MNKKDLKCKYVFVTSNEMERTKNTQIEESNFDESLNSIFDMYEIPSEYRKIVIKLNPFFSFKAAIEDYITKEKYCFEADKYGDDKLRTFNNINFYNSFSFEKILIQVSYEEVTAFYSELKKQGLLSNYIKALSKFYNEESISENIKKYNNIISKYNNGYFGDKDFSLCEIFDLANESNLIDKMSISELQYLINNTSIVNRSIFIEELNNRLGINNGNKKKTLKNKKSIV